MNTSIFSAPDISCGGCANAIKRAIGALPGVSGVEVEIGRKEVAVMHDDTLSASTLTDALDRAGFPATTQSVPESDTKSNRLPMASGGSCCCN